MRKGETPNERVDEATLQRCRQAPALAAEIRPDLVVCLECGVLVRRLTNMNCHARKQHGMDSTAYLAKWPGAPLISADAERLDRNKRNLYKEIHRDELKAKRREYLRRPEVRARDNQKARERWPNWFAEHREAERERSRIKHERFRERDNARNRQNYWANLEDRRAYNREYQKRRTQLAWRPTGWNDKPIMWRIIGTELLSEDYISNKELAARLDDSRILVCPYGASWVDSVDKMAFQKIINKIRGWVKKPGRMAS